MKGNKIACDGQIALSKANANVQIIGVQNADGSYPELNFSDFMAKYIGKAHQMRQLVSEFMAQTTPFKT